MGPSGLSGRVAIVTGAYRNIGAAIAKRLAAAGADVIVNHPDQATAAAATRVVSEILEAGGHAITARADVTVADQVTEMVALAQAHFGPPDVLVNNAAIGVTGHAEWHALDPESWARVLQVNVTGAFICARAMFPSMRARGRGDVISMSSVTALLGRTHNLHYVTSKAALLGFTRALAREAGPDNIRVNAIVAGAIRTPQEDAYGDEHTIAATLLPLQSLKRRGTPDDIASVIVFLVSEESGFITGQSIVVDGGWVMS